VVAVTVVLVALASTIVFDLGSDVNEPSDVSANLEFDYKEDKVAAGVIRDENAGKSYSK
jgi:FlaG/FlaF family flagellin (archaellin)